MKRLEKLDRMLEILEECIDPDHADEAVERQYKAINFLPVDHIPLIIQINTSNDRFELLKFEDSFDNHENMLYNELLYSWGSIYNSVTGGVYDDYIYHIRSSTGPILVASAFGANCRVAGDFAWVDHMERSELIKSMAHGVPAVDAGLFSMVFDRYNYYHERLKEYPKCARAIRITQPDLQGPFDIADLLLGSTQIFCDLYEDPKFIHSLLELITQALINEVRAFEPYIQNSIVHGNSLVVYAAMYRGKTVIKDDTASTMISEDHYEEFSAYYNRIVMDNLEGAALHHCGEGRPWHYKQFAWPTCSGVNFGQPQFHKLADKMLYLEQNIPIVGWGSEESYDILDDFYELAPRTGITLACMTDSTEKAKRIYEMHLERCAKM